MTGKGRIDRSGRRQAGHTNRLWFHDKYWHKILCHNFYTGTCAAANVTTNEAPTATNALVVHCAVHRQAWL
jgi:hypothetical protein